jgi:hypothetical protein
MQKIWTDEKTEDELQRIGKERSDKNLCMYVSFSQETNDWLFCDCESQKPANDIGILAKLCHEHSSLISDYLEVFRSLLKNNLLDEAENLLKKSSLTNPKYDTPRYFREVNSPTMIYRVSSECQLMLVYIEKVVKVYRDTAPDEFYEQYPYDILITNSNGEEYSFFEIPEEEDATTIFLSHIRRRVKRDFEEVDVTDFCD